MTGQGRSDPETGAGITLAHLSDPHLPLTGPVPWHSVLNKRALSLLSWHRKRRHHHRPEILAMLIADMRDHAPDQIAVTGDLTNLGLESEYRAARRWLENLGRPERVMVIPGNHEALIRGAWDAGAAQWLPYWQGDAAPVTVDVSDAFPYMRRRGMLALIGVSSAVATPPAFASGAVSPAQLARLAPMLRKARDAGLCRVLMIHHPPLDGTVSARKALRDAAAFRAVLQAEGVELVLHGHSHRHHHQTLETRDGPASVIGVPSASSLYPEAAAYHLYHIRPTAAGWEIDVTARHATREQEMATGRCTRLTLARAHAACAP
ncbi:metallophosphoesterase family protein [Roseovarius mucosus]|uniref:Cyclic 3',5'-adenosine monophosphate phosphodiesterase n=1 Tax=Roseovarius mucosus TaxID=215743 RepID=A0A1V0RIN7_9RHOB|nr:metallophosphoesterase [Roseovarius mucosus]ARE81614.1 cyclic 3',5'-adenosine monophosphate phosphodiesterase [Roseovarius mucosus]